MKRVGRASFVVLAVLAAAVLTPTASGDWLPVWCGGDCIDLYCVPPAPPMAACIQFGGGCGGVPWHPDCANMDTFSPL
jgi:hypothetical protein